MFNFLKTKFFSFCSSFAKKTQEIFSGNKITTENLDEFFKTLVSFDFGLDISKEIVLECKKQIDDGKIKNPEELFELVKEYLKHSFSNLPNPNLEPGVILLLGINGAGKTTTAAKLAHKFSKDGKKVLLIAADTFRAGAIDQLKKWSEVTEVDLFIGKENADPASVIFEAQEKNSSKSYDHIIIDTAGRLHTNFNLLKELEKTVKVTNKVFAGKKIAPWVVVDSMLGQNSFEQVKTFQNLVPLEGVILTKLDGSAKGGVIVGIAKNFKLPVVYTTFAENDLDGITPFVAEDYVNELFS